MDVDFQKMGIYIDGRTKNELDELLAVKSQSEVTARDLYGMSCMHYLDDEPMNEAASFFGLSRDAPADADAPPKKILDFGAGFAGDARVMACEFPGSELTCVEVQPHIHAAAERFTALVNALPAANPQELVPLLGADLAAQAHNELVAHVLEASSSPAFARPSSGKKGAATRRRPGGD